MFFESPLIKGTFIKRYKRFLVDVKLSNGDIITAHCPNSGSMLSLLNNNSAVFLSQINNPKAKLNYKLELMTNNSTLVGVNTLYANKVVEEALEQSKIDFLNNYNFTKREATYTKGCRFDFKLSSGSMPDCFLEVKSVTLSRVDSLAEFPDAVTTRGLKHLEELMNAVDQGFNAVMLYLVQRNDCTKFAISSDIDPKYYKALIKAKNKGVKILCYSCLVSEKQIKLDKILTIIL